MIETLDALMIRFFGNSDMLRIMLVVGAALTFCVLTLGLSAISVALFDPARRRALGPSTEKADKGRQLVRFQTLLGPVAAYVLPQDEIEKTRVQAKLVHAGFRGPNAMQIFYSIKTVLTIVLPAIVFLAAGWLPELSLMDVVMYMIVAMSVGLLGPNIVLERLLERRLRTLRNGFPDALDLLVVCVEAGLGISQAIQRVADELIVSHTELSQELNLVNAEIRAGVDRVVALKNLADRTGVDDIRGLVSLLVQTIRFGTSIADSLRVYSEEFRDKRMQAAEEQAAKIGTKLLFPLIVFMFPGFFVVALGPAIVALIGVFRDFGQ